MMMTPPPPPLSASNTHLGHQSFMSLKLSRRTTNVRDRSSR